MIQTKKKLLAIIFLALGCFFQAEKTNCCPPGYILGGLDIVRLVNDTAETVSLRWSNAYTTTVRLTMAPGSEVEIEFSEYAQRPKRVNTDASVVLTKQMNERPPIIGEWYSNIQRIKYENNSGTKKGTFLCPVRIIPKDDDFIAPGQEKDSNDDKDVARVETILLSTYLK